MKGLISSNKSNHPKKNQKKNKQTKTTENVTMSIWKKKCGNAG